MGGTTVYAVDYFNLGEYFSNIFSNVHEQDVQADSYFETNGEPLSVKVDGGKLTAIIGDGRYWYIPYKGKISNPTFVSGNPVTPTIMDKPAIPYSYLHRPLTDDTGVFVLSRYGNPTINTINILTSTDGHLETGIDLSAFEKGKKLNNIINDAYIEDARIVDNQLYVAIKSNYVRDAIGMELYLKDNKTGKILGRQDSSSFDYNILGGVFMYYYDVDNLNYSLVVEEANCYTLTPQKQIADDIILTPNLKVGEMQIKEILISALSCQISSFSNTGGSIDSFSLKMKSGEIISYDNLSTHSDSESHINSYAFPTPIEPKQIEAILINYLNEKVSIPVNYQ